MPDLSHPPLMVTLRMPPRSTEPHPSRPEATVPAVTPNSVPSNITKRFSQSSIAIALRLSKAKPQGLSMKDYLDRLRRNIKPGQPIPQDQLRYIDTTEFWKEQFHRLHLEKKAQDDEIRYLKEAHGLSKKRSREIFEQPDASIQSQEDQMDLDTNQGQVERLAVSMVNDDFLRLNSYALRIRRHRISLESNAIDYNSLDKINSFANQILKVLALLENALPDCCLTLKLVKDNEDMTRVSFAFQLLMNQFGLSFLLCLATIDNLFRTIPGRTYKTEIVYRMVMVFKQGLDILRSVSTDQVAHEKAVRNHRDRQERQKIDEGEYLISRYLANALAAIAHNAQWNVQQPAHLDILEGLVFLVLENTGQLLSEAMFGEHVAASDLPGSITQSNDKVVEGFVRPEARYIIQVLQATIGVGERTGLVAQMLATRKTLNAPFHSAVPAPSPLLSRAKELMQGTLIKSGLGDADLESLKLTDPPLAFSNVNAADPKEYGKNWFIEQVWGLIGWDIVRSR